VVLDDHIAIYQTPSFKRLPFAEERALLCTTTRSVGVEPVEGLVTRDARLMSEPVVAEVEAAVPHERMAVATCFGAGASKQPTNLIAIEASSLVQLNAAVVWRSLSATAPGVISQPIELQIAGEIHKIPPPTFGTYDAAPGIDHCLAITAPRDARLPEVTTDLVTVEAFALQFCETL
jgi:hypothetical protein